MTFDLPDDVVSAIGSLETVHCQPFDTDRQFTDLAGSIAHLPGSVVLLSGGDLDCARHHILGAFPWLTLSATGRRIQLQVGEKRIGFNGRPFDALRSIVEQLRLPEGGWPEPIAAGLLGYMAYDLKDNLEHLPRTSVDELQLPHMVFYAPRLLVVHDKQTRHTQLMIPMRHGETHDIHGLIADFHQLVDGQDPVSDNLDADTGLLQSNFTARGYRKAVAQVIDYIGAGDVYQVNLSQRFQVPFKGSGYQLFCHLYRSNPAPFFAYINAGDHQIVSTSPERFMLRAQTRVEARPIKGTRPRGKTPAQDAALRKELSESAKDDAELSMIVDLMRNDIGKVCQPGSVQVTEHKRLEAYQNVYHLVSIVKGRMDAGKDSVDLIEAAFPGGSITGCPKVRAMEIIDELESCRRHIYCGSIGYLSFHDTMDLSIAIRTATLVNNTLRFSVGGGIVFDSQPKAEYEETMHKGQTLMAAISKGEQSKPEPMAWQNGRLLPLSAAVVPVTDQGLLYGFGFFETVRMDRGRAPLLETHLQRFAQTWRVLMPDSLPDISWETVFAQVVAANDLADQCAALKLLVTRGSRIAPPWDHTLLVTARPYTHRLQALNVDGLHLGTYPHARLSPLAHHKTLNYLYYLQAGQWAQQQGFHEALILNPDGSLSETNTANILLVNGREIIRPQSPAVLPGVMADVVCRQLVEWDYTIRQQPVRPEMFHSAEQVLITNALMGAVPIRSLDHEDLPCNGEWWRQLNDALIPGWLG